MRLAEMERLSGVFPSQWIRAAADYGIIEADGPIHTGPIQPNRLGGTQFPRR